jgi:SAM-dependent methyltransferase
LAELRPYQTLPTTFATAQFSVIWFVETIEHLLPEQRTAILAELRRLLRPDGYLIVTTPNEEPLAKSHVICPDCGCRFHRIQHITSWSVTTLVQELSGAGFTVDTCQAVHLTEEGWYSRFRGWLSARFRGYRPNLIYIGRPSREPAPAAHVSG